MKQYNDNPVTTSPDRKGGVLATDMDARLRSSTNPLAYGRGWSNQRGVATILVISSLLVLTLIGFALITVVTYQKMASGASSTAIGKNENVDISINKIKDKIQRDLLRSYTGVDADGVAVLSSSANLADAYGFNAMTYPDANRKWLASIEPFDTDLNADNEINLNGTIAGLATTDGVPSNDFRRWRQISMIADADNALPTNTFVNKSTMALLTGVTQADVDYTPFTTASPDSTDLVADTDGDGFADARWVVLGTPQSDGVVTVMATRIIDNGGMLNLNTVSNAVGGTDVPLGQTPADICLFYPLYYANGTAGTWGSAFTSTSFVPGVAQGDANWASFFALKATAAVPNSQLTRLNYWLAFGSRQNQAFGLYPNTTVFNDRIPMNMQDELELRFLAGRNSSSRSMLENTLDRANVDEPAASNSGPLRSYFAQSHPTSTIRNREDRRRLFTTINGTHAIRVPATVTESGTPEFREPMPLWLSEINVEQAPPASPANTPVGVPFFKLNPNADSPVRLGYMFENLLRQNEFLAARYSTSPGIIYPDAINTAYMLAANIARYRFTNAGVPYNVGDDEVYDPTLTQFVSPQGVTYYGLTLQPFFTMVAYSEVYRDPNDDGQILAGDPLPGSYAPAQKLFAAELRNPFPVPIDLSKFAIRYNDSPITISASQRLLNPGDYVVVHTDDANWVKVFGPTVPASKRIAISAAAEHLAAFPLDTSIGNGIFEIVSLDAPTVVIDRFQKSSAGVTDTSWMRPTYPAPDATAYPIALPASAGPPPLYNFTQSLCYLQRWWAGGPDNVNRPTATPALGNGMAQSYMLENSSTNSTENPITSDTNTGRYRTVAGTGPTDYNPDADITAAVTARIGNNAADVNAPAQAIAKSGDAPGGDFTQWPAFQICYPFTYNAGTPASSTFGGLITTPADVLPIVTVSHTATNTFGENLARRYTEATLSPTTPSLGNLPPLLHYGQVPPIGTPTQRNMGWDGSAYNVPLIREASPRVPLAMTIVAALDTLTSNSNQPFVAGTLNVNTAPAEVMESLPFMYRWENASVGRPGATGGYTQWFGTRGIVGYRDTVDLSVMTGSLPGSATSPNASPAGPNFSNRPTATSIANLRTDRGFATPSELLMVRSINAGNNDWFYTMNALALDSATTPAGVIDSTLDQVVDDTEEDAMVFAKVNNLVTTRSDVFTAWVMLKNQKLNRTTNLYETLSTTRYVATILRGVVVASGVDGTLASTTTFDILPAALPTGYNGKWLIGKDIKLRRRTGTTIASPTETLTARIVNCTGTTPLTLTLKFNQGAFANAAGQYSGTATLPALNWEYQIVDQPRVLGFTQSK